MVSNLMKKAAMAFYAMTVTALASADIVTGRIVDADTKSPLQQADVSLVLKNGASQIVWRLDVDSTGRFSQNVWTEGRLFITCKYIGYHTARRTNYSFGDNSNDTIDLGTIELRPTVIMAPEVQVSAKIPRVTMSGDTIVFHPEAFKLEDGARLSELISKLPGVQSKDGALYWNGKPLRLIMNGKDLFGGSGIVAELPAEVADKIKLYDRKSELSRHTGRDDGNEDNVLDIQVKHGFLDKWFGRVEADYMTGRHYSVQFSGNRLSDHDPVLVFGQMNNENEQTEVTPASSSGTSISSFGKSQYGSLGYQHNWKTAGTDEDSNNSVYVAPMLNHVDGSSETHSQRQTFMEGQERTWENSDSWQNTHSLNPKLRMGLWAYADSVNRFGLRASVSYDKSRGFNGFANESGSETMNDIISRQNNYATSEGEETKAEANYEWEHYMGSTGSLGIYGSTDVSTGTSRSWDKRHIEYLRADSAINLLQYSRTPMTTVSTSVMPKLSTWLGERLYVELSDRVGYDQTHTSRSLFYDVSGQMTAGDRPVTEDISNRERKHINNWNNSMRLSGNIKIGGSLSLKPTLTWLLQREKASYRYGSLDTTAVRNSSFVMPQISMQWKIDRQRNMEWEFTYNTSNPDLVSTFDYHNTIDPQYIQSGNSSLKRSHNYDIRYRFTRIWLRRQFFLYLSAGYQREINPLSSLYTYNPLTAAYHVKPVNVRGGDNLNFGLNLDKSFGFYIRATNNAVLSWSKSYGYLTRSETGEEAQSNRQRSFSFNDRLELNYDDDALHLELYNDMAMSRYRYSASPDANSTTLRMNYGFEGGIEKRHYAVGVNVYDEFRHGFMGSSMNGHRWICNMRAGYKFPKINLMVWIEGNDIFNNDRNYSSTYSAYENSESWTDHLHHYLSIGIRYRFDAKDRR